MNNILSNYPTLEETNGIEKSINDLFQFFTPNRYYADIPIEISEDNNNYYYTLEAPGITTNDINIDVDDNNNLCIEMNKEDKDEQKNKKIYYSKIRYGTIRKKMKIPHKCDINDINANYKNGILKIVIPKRKEETKKKKIQINEK